MKAPVPNPPLNGLFFYSELENCATTDICFNTGMYGYWGATNELADAAADELFHGRVNYDQNPPFPYDLMVNYAYTFNSSGVSADFGYNLAAGGGGNFYLL